MEFSSAAEKCEGVRQERDLHARVGSLDYSGRKGALLKDPEWVRDVITRMFTPDQATGGIWGGVEAGEAKGRRSGVSQCALLQGAARAFARQGRAWDRGCGMPELGTVPGGLGEGHTEVPWAV